MANFEDYRIPFLVVIIILTVATLLLIITTVVLIVWLRKLQKKIEENDPLKGRFRLARPKTIDGRYKDEIFKPKYDTSSTLEQGKNTNNPYQNQGFNDDLENIVFAEDMNPPKKNQNRRPDAAFSNQNFSYLGQNPTRNENFLSRPQQPWRREQNNNFTDNANNFY